MTTLDDLAREIELIKQRNKRVESDKAWETSWTRKIIVIAFTYIVISTFFLFAGIVDPFVNAIVPVLAFILSTISLSFVKNFWQENIYKK